MNVFAVAFYNPMNGLELEVWEDCDDELDAVLGFLEEKNIQPEASIFTDNSTTEEQLQAIYEWLWDEMEMEIKVEQV